MKVKLEHKKERPAFSFKIAMVVRNYALLALHHILS